MSDGSFHHVVQQPKTAQSLPPLPALAHINPVVIASFCGHFSRPFPHAHTLTHSQLLDPVSTDPPSCFCPAVLPTSLASSWASSHTRNLDSPSALFRPAHLPSPAAPHSPWTDLISGRQPALTEPSQSQPRQPKVSHRADTLPELCICHLPGILHGPIVSAITRYDARVRVRSWASSPPWPSRRLLPRQRPFRRRYMPCSACDAPRITLP